MLRWQRVGSKSQKSVACVGTRARSPYGRCVGPRAGFKLYKSQTILINDLMKVLFLQCNMHAGKSSKGVLQLLS